MKRADHRSPAAEFRRRLVAFGPVLFPLPASSDHPVPACNVRTLSLALACLALCLVATALAYWPAVDLPLMSESTVSQQLSRDHAPHMFLLRSGFLEQGSGTYYRPGVRILDGLFIRATGGELVGRHQHAFSIFLHLVCVALLWGVIWRWTRHALLPATLAALWFGLHPSLTAAVVFVSVRWNLYTVAAFLIALHLLTWFLNRSEECVPKWSGLAMLPFVFLVGMIAEMGAMAMGVIGLWLLIECWRRQSGQLFKWLLLPLAAAPAIYVVMRFIALGGMGDGYGGGLDRAERLRRIAEGFLHDVTVVVNPIPIPLANLTGYGIAHGLLSVLLVGAGIVALILVPPVQRTLRQYPVVLVGLLAFLLLQIATVWKLPNRPIDVHGIDRSYLFYLPIMLMALGLGLLMGRIVRASAAWGCVVVFAMIALIWSEAALLRRGVMIWRDGGETMLEHRELLLPFLRSQPEGTDYYLYRFPELIVEPRLPWAQLYYWSHRPILTHWLGEDDPQPGNVYSSGFHGPMPDGFSGIVIEAKQDGTLTWHSIRAEDIARRYIESVPRLPGPVDLFDPQAEEPLLGWWTSEIEIEQSSNDGSVLRLHLTGDDPQMGRAALLAASDYGFMRVRMRLVEVDETRDDLLAQFYFRGADSDFGEGRSITVALETGDQWQTLNFPLFLNALWRQKNTVYMLRFDPLNAPGLVEIDRMWFENNSELAREFLAD